MITTGHAQQHRLASLITPLDTPTFMAEFWGKKCFYTQAGLGAAEDLPSRLAGCSTQELLSMTQDPVVVMHKTASGDYRGTKVPASAALDFYEARAALYFDLSRNIPEVASWITALAESLGQRQSAVRVSVFVSPGGGTTECHFDSNENFTIQLRGHKRWKMAPNSTVINPMDRFTMTGDMQASMALYWKNEMPVNLELSEIADLAPGSMLYVPRGYWHTVEALEPSLSLNFCIRPESWISFFLPLFERRLLAEKEWRENATGIRGTGEERMAARAVLARLLDSVGETCADLKVEELIPAKPADQTSAIASIGPEEAVHPNRTALLFYNLANVDKSKSKIQVDIGATMCGWTAPAAMIPVCRWIASQEAVTLRRLLEQFKGVSKSDVQQLFYKLIATGFLICDQGMLRDRQRLPVNQEVPVPEKFHLEQNQGLRKTAGD